MKEIMLAFILVISLASCGGGDGSDAAAATETITGEVVYRALGCAFDAEAKAEHKRVVVKDGSGEVLGTATSGEGSCTEKGPGSTITAPYSVKVDSVEHYEVEVEGIPGSLTYSRSELESDNWTVDLDIGSSY